MSKASDEALYNAVCKVARSKTPSCFDYRDMAHSALLYVLEHEYENDEHATANAVLKCKNNIADAFRNKMHSKTMYPGDHLTAVLDKQHRASANLFEQERYVLLKQSLKEYIDNPPKATRGRPPQILVDVLDYVSTKPSSE